MIDISVIDDATCPICRFLIRIDKGYRRLEVDNGTITYITWCCNSCNVLFRRPPVYLNEIND